MATVAGASTQDSRSRNSALPDAATLAGWLALLVFAGVVAVAGKAAAGDAPAPTVNAPAQAVAPAAAVATGVGSSPAAEPVKDAAQPVAALPPVVASRQTLPGLPFLPPSGFHEIPIGAAYADGAWEYTVVDVRRIAHLGAGLIVDVPSGEFVIAGLRLRRIAEGTGAAGPLGIGAAAVTAPSAQDFQLRDAAGTAYAPASLLASDRWARSAGYDGGVLPRSGSSLNVGDSATYALAFDVPAGTDRFRLRLLRPKIDVVLAESQ